MSLTLTMAILGTHFAAATTPAWDVIRRHPDAPVVVAHRGASKLAPENTVSAIVRARELASVAVEFDLHQSSDGELVVIHDAGLARTTNGKGRIRRTPWSKIATLDAGSWFSPAFTGEPIPRLRDALEALGTEMVAAIEVKTRGDVMKSIQTDLKATGTTDRAIIFSFKPQQIRAATELMPRVPALLLIDPEGRDSSYPVSIVASATAIGAAAIGLNYRAVDAGIVEAIHDAGLPVFVYTVDEAPDVREMVGLQVDGIISNRPRATASRISRIKQPSQEVSQPD